MTAIPYLRSPVFRDGSVMRFARHRVEAQSRLEETLLDLVFEGGADLDELAAAVVEAGEAATLAKAREGLRESFSQPASVIGLIELPLEPDYDVVLVEQGYGGVYVHTVELTKKLQQQHRCLLISPVEPLFGDDAATNVISLAGMREQVEGLSYFS